MKYSEKISKEKFQQLIRGPLLRPNEIVLLGATPDKFNDMVGLVSEMIEVKSGIDVTIDSMFRTLEENVTGYCLSDVVNRPPDQALNDAFRENTLGKPNNRIVILTTIRTMPGTRTLLEYRMYDTPLNLVLGSEYMLEYSDASFTVLRPRRSDRLE